MILTMAYLLLIAGLMGLAAFFGERLCAEIGWPRRSAWLVALVASIALPAFAFSFGAAPSAETPFLTLPQLFDQVPVIDVNLEAAAAATKGASFLNWPDLQILDSTLTVLWIIATAGLLFLYLLAALRVRGMTRKAQTRTIGDQTILLSDCLGPAVLGFLKPRIVLPHWLAERNTPLRRQVLNHEREHIAAQDQRALLAALLLMAIMPWNIALWWQLRRLRAAIELDCDGRVLRSGADPRDYSEALLAVGRHTLRTPFAAVALTEPMPELEKRIRTMLASARQFSASRFGSLFVVCVSTLGLAIAVNAPKAQQIGGSPQATTPDGSAPTIRDSVFKPLSDAEACFSQQDRDCILDALDEINKTPDLTPYESARLQNLYAFAYVGTDTAAAIRAYEAILALPQAELPNSLIGNTMRSLAFLYVQSDRLQEGLDLYDRWLALPFVEVSPMDHYQRATFLYQLAQYPAAIAELEMATGAGEDPNVAWYELLYALQTKTGDQQGAAKTLEFLDSHFPNQARADAVARGELPLPGSGFVSGGEYLPIVKPVPTYPVRARARGVEGYVVVSYTVTTTGSTKDIVVTESSSKLFERAAVEAAQKYKYRPRIIDGVPVEVAGVTTRIVFASSDDD